MQSCSCTVAVLVLAIASVQAVTATSMVSLRWKDIAAKHLAAAGLPDPKCKSGIIGLRGKVCCAGYCGECTDYPSCANVREQDSQNACCASKVLGMKCGLGGAPANVCLKTCSEAVPPCIMDLKVKIPETDRVAGNDCNKAVTSWRNKVDRTMEAAIAAIPTQTTVTATTTTPVIYFHLYKASGWCHKNDGPNPKVEAMAGEVEDFEDHPQLKDPEACAEHCASTPGCKFFIHKNDPEAEKNPFRCNLFDSCLNPTLDPEAPHADVYKMGPPAETIETPAGAVYHSYQKDAYCHKTGFHGERYHEKSTLENEVGTAEDVLAHPELEEVESCADHCADMEECRYFAYKEDPDHSAKAFRCVLFAHCNFAEFDEEKPDYVVYKMGAAPEKLVVWDYIGSKD